MIVEAIIIPEMREAHNQLFDLPGLASGQVLIRTTTCALCTWEQRVYRGAKPTYPFWGGHEVCGYVESVSSDVEQVSVGNLVAVARMRRCGSCEFCRRDLDNHCAYVHPEPADGLPIGPRGLSNLLVVPAYQAIPIGSRIGPIHGSLVEPLACVLRSIDRSKIKPGDAAAVIGDGTLGRLHTAALRARQIRVTNELQKESASAVFCTRGGRSAITEAIDRCARGGTVVLFQSLRDSDKVTFSANDLHYREVSIVGTISQRLQDFLSAATLLEEHPEILESLSMESINHRYPKDAFERALEPGVNRVLVIFDS